jgi:hypothetical protein
LSRRQWCRPTFALATPASTVVPSTDSDRDWLTYAAMSVAIAALGLAGFSELRRRSERAGT